ncbi:MAG TPA: hypothetical protein VMS17_08420 [Gemmataceae bacterium]|nr:hypothetical protein [Gemmataceae bacterium]
MGLPRGSTIPLSPLRRVMCDFLHVSRRVPLVAIERRFFLADVVAARRRLEHRPSWFALFLKAYALVARRRAELRRAYLSFPWPRIHQHTCNVAYLTIARRHADEDVVLGLQIRHPEERSAAAIDDLIRRARTEPVEQFADFRRVLLLSRLPGFLRRLAFWAGLSISGDLRAKTLGTFGVTGVGALGAASLHMLSPQSTTLTYGVFAEDGSVPVRLFYDHRILDGVAPAAALADLEETLCGPILEELRGGTRRAA